MSNQIDILTDALDLQPDDKRKGPDRRDSVIDRRAGIDHRHTIEHNPGLDRRRGPGRRRSDDRKAAEEGEMTDEQFQFLMAIEQYKRQNTRPFPTWTEVLEVIKALGYRKVAQPGKLQHAKQPEKKHPLPT